MLTIKVNAFHERLLTEFSRVRIARGFKRGQGDSAPVMCREYLQFLENNECEFVTASHVFHYRRFCEHLKTRCKFRGEGTLSSVHQQHIRYGVHSFYEFLLEADYMDSIPISGSLFHIPEGKEKPVLSKKHIAALFVEAKTPQEKAILILAYNCGLRRSEIERLRISDYQPTASTISVREGKYFKSRVVPVTSKMNVQLSDYLNKYRLLLEPKNNLFLVDGDSNPIDGEIAYRIIRNLARRAKIREKPVGLHILRNSIAVHMLDRGAEIEFVQRFLGHSLIDTTMLYATRRRKRISLKRRINATKKYA